MKLRDIRDRLERVRVNWRLEKQIVRVEQYLQANELPSQTEQNPVLFFNASTRIHRLSINGAFSLLASWGIRQQGIPVLYAVCQRGMEQCILGTNREDYTAAPPCKHCIPFSQRLFPSQSILPLTMDNHLGSRLSPTLQDQSMEQLTAWHYKELPLGQLCRPGLRWALRRHHLPDDEPTRKLFREYLISAANLVERFDAIFEEIQPRALVIFNGITYPEAVARQVARNRGIPVITHEVGLLPYSAFFTYKEATFREINLPPSGRLSKEEEERLDDYLTKRFKGKFTMAGIKFWPEMTSIPEGLQTQMDRYRQIVPIFTNVIFDTSQIHANALFDDMFSWLDELGHIIQNRPDTLFVIRAHPDEDRPGKESRENVADWFNQSRIKDFPNVRFFAPSEYISSYDLIHRAKLVLVYNSSIGLEASIMGAAVLCAGRARYTQLPTTYFPSTRKDYIDQLKEFLDAESLSIPPDFSHNAKRFLYHELYRSSLDFSDFLRPYPNAAGMTLLTPFEPDCLEKSPAIGVIRRGILEGEPFNYP